MNATKIEKIRTVTGPTLVSKTYYSIVEQRVHHGPYGSYIEFAVVHDRSEQPHMVFDTEQEALLCLDSIIENQRAFEQL